MWRTISNQFRSRYQWKGSKPKRLYLQQQRFRSFSVRYPIALSLTIPFITTSNDEGERGPLVIPNKYVAIFSLLSVITGGFVYQNSLPNAPKVSVKAMTDDGYVIVNIKNENVIGHKLEYAESLSHDDVNFTWKSLEIEDGNNNIDYRVGPLKSTKMYLLRVSSKNAFGYGSTSETIYLLYTLKKSNNEIPWQIYASQHILGKVLTHAIYTNRVHGTAWERGQKEAMFSYCCEIHDVIAEFLSKCPDCREKGILLSTIKLIKKRAEYAMRSGPQPDAARNEICDNLKNLITKAGRELSFAVEEPAVTWFHDTVPGVVASGYGTLSLWDCYKARGRYLHEFVQEAISKYAEK